VATHLLERSPPEFASAERHFRESFILGDQNFESRYMLAQLLFRKGEIEQAVNLFAEIGRRAPKQFRKFAPRNDNPITSSLPEYAGIIDNVGEGFFFIRTGSYPSKVYSHRSAFDEEIVDDVQVGHQVTFRMRFNRQGPVAVIVHIVRGA